MTNYITIAYEVKFLQRCSNEDNYDFFCNKILALCYLKFDGQKRKRDKNTTTKQSRTKIQKKKEYTAKKMSALHQFISHFKLESSLKFLLKI